MTTRADANVEARKMRLFSKVSTQTLIGAVRLIGDKDRATAEQRLVYAWTCDELERRAGGIQDDIAFGEFMDANEDMEYAEMLLAWFPTLTQEG